MCDALSGRWTSSGAWPERGWPRARARVSEAIAVLLSAAERAAAAGRFAEEVMCLQTATQFGDRTAHPGCASSNRSSRGRASAWRPGSPKPCATVTPTNYPRCQRNSSTWAISSPPSMRPPTPPSCIAATTSGDRRWDARRGQTPWPPNAVARNPGASSGQRGPAADRPRKQRS